MSKEENAKATRLVQGSARSGVDSTLTVGLPAVVSGGADDGG
jgi:hypothetical protein